MLISFYKNLAVLVLLIKKSLMGRNIKISKLQMQNIAKDLDMPLLSTFNIAQTAE